MMFREVVRREIDKAKKNQNKRGRDQRVATIIGTYNLLRYLIHNEV